MPRLVLHDAALADGTSGSLRTGVSLAIEDGVVLASLQYLRRSTGPDPVAGGVVDVLTTITNGGSNPRTLDQIEKLPMVQLPRCLVEGRLNAVCGFSDEFCVSKKECSELGGRSSEQKMHRMLFSSRIGQLSARRFTLQIPGRQLRRATS